MAVEVSVLVTSSWPPVKMEGHPSVDCDSELQVVIAVSEDDTESAPESYMAQKECPGGKWKIKSSAVFCNLKNAVAR